jgi:hypothetical protein
MKTAVILKHPKKKLHLSTENEGLSIFPDCLFGAVLNHMHGISGKSAREVLQSPYCVASSLI